MGGLGKIVMFHLSLNTAYLSLAYTSLGKGSKTQGTETFRWGGTPPRPRGLHGRDFSEKLAEKS